MSERGRGGGVSHEIRDTQSSVALCEKYGNNIAEAKQNRPPCMWIMRRSLRPKLPLGLLFTHLSHCSSSLNLDYFFCSSPWMDRGYVRDALRTLSISPRILSPKFLTPFSLFFFKKKLLRSCTQVIQTTNAAATSFFSQFHPLSYCTTARPLRDLKALGFWEYSCWIQMSNGRRSAYHPLKHGEK